MANKLTQNPGDIPAIIPITANQEVFIMAEFFVEKAAQSNGIHLVHKSTCTQLPAKDAIEYLGSISNCDSAIQKASQFFTQPTACSVCSPVAQAS